MPSHPSTNPELSSRREVQRFRYTGAKYDVGGFIELNTLLGVDDFRGILSNVAGISA